MKTGLERKEDRWKVMVLGAMGIFMAYLVYSNVFSDSGNPPPTNSQTTAVSSPAAETGPAPSLTGSAAPRAQPNRRNAARATGEFKPKLRGTRPEDRIDPAKVDPTLKLDLLAKVQSIPLEGGTRNIFQFGAAPPPVPTGPIPKVGKIDSKGPVITDNKPPPNLGPPPPPPPPPIPLKYYGFSSIKGEARKRAFFLDGDEIIVAWEGETIRSRYKVGRVGVNSVEVEDTQFKNKQSMPLAEEVSAG